MLSLQLTRFQALFDQDIHKHIQETLFPPQIVMNCLSKPLVDRSAPLSEPTASNKGHKAS